MQWRVLCATDKTQLNRPQANFSACFLGGKVGEISPSPLGFDNNAPGWAGGGGGLGGQYSNSLDKKLLRRGFR